MVIGYTPDVVINHWLGFPTTDENHYLAGSTSNGAAHVFRNIAIPFYLIRQEVPLRLKMLISKIGYHQYKKTSQTNDNSQTDDNLSDIRGRAQV